MNIYGELNPSIQEKIQIETFQVSAVSDRVIKNTDTSNAWFEHESVEMETERVDWGLSSSFPKDLMTCR